MRRVVKEIKTRNYHIREYIIKLTICLSVFLLMFFLFGNAAYTDDYYGDYYSKKRLTITGVQVDLDNETISIYGKNLGSNPYAMLDDYELKIIDVTADTLIQAWLPADLEPGTYRLLVAKGKPKGKLKASKTDTMDVTISIYTETDPFFSDSPDYGITAGHISNWNSAYGWGDHT
jgi:hypothetical protein